MSDQPTHPPEEPAHPGMLHLATDSPARGWLARAAIALTGLMFILILSLIFWRSATVQRPSNAIEIHVPIEVTNAVAVIEGVGLSEPFTAPLLSERNPNARFFVGPGYYTVTIRSSDGKDEIYPRRELLIPSDRRYQRYRVQFPADG
jgi:hypothetical protein